MMLRFVILASLLLLAGCGATEVSRGLPLLAGDVAAASLVVPKEDAAPVVPTHEAAVMFAVDEARELHLRPRPVAPKSRGFVRRIDGAALASGVELVTTSAGAVVQLRPLASGDARSIDPLHPDALVIVDAAGGEHRAAEAFVAADDGTALRDAGAAFGPGVAVGVLARGLGAGRLGIRAEGVAADATFLLHVHEPESDVELQVFADADTYLHGDTATIRAVLHEDGETLAPKDAHARIRRPDGTVLELPMARSPGSEPAFEGSLRLRDLVPAHGRTWMVEVDATVVTEDGDTLRRSARTAFAVAVPTARPTDDPELGWDDGDLIARVPLEIAAPGRYAATATLYAVGPTGAARPLAIAQSAAALTPGEDALTLRFAGSLTGSAKTYELRDLRLQDQGRMAILHRQARAAMLTVD